MKKALLALTIVAMVCGHATAADLYWDGDGTGVVGGGVGTWNTTLTRWSPTAGGSTYQAWVNANVDSAHFTGTAGAVTIGANVTVNSLTFDVGGYSLAAGSTVTFAGANPTITVNVVGTGNTTIAALYTGTSQITKMGTGRLELNNSSNTNAGGYNIQQGFINLAAANRLGTGAALPGTLDADWFIFGGGGLTSSNGAAQDLGATRGVTLAGKAWFGASAAGNPVTVSAPITGTGDIIVANATTTAVNGGSASPLNTTFNAGGVLILSNTANNWTGDAQIGAGTLRTGASNVIPDTAIVHLTLAGVQFDMATNNTTETVKSISGTAGTIALGSAGKLTVANPAGETYGSVLTGTVGSQLIKNGAGALSLTGSSTGFSGEIVLNTGTLGIGAANALGSNALGPVFSINGGKISNTGSGGRTVSANLVTKINVDLVADDSLAATQGQINFTGVSTMIGGDRTFTINGATTNIGFADLREDVAGRSVTKEGTGILAFTGAATGTAFTGDVNVNAGKIQVTGTSIIGTGNNLVKLNGGTLNSSASRTISSDPITNPISVTADSAITTTSSAATVNMAFTSNSIAGGAATTLTFRNDGANDATDLYRPRLSGSGFDYQGKIAVANGAVGKTQLEFANTGATIQTFSGEISGNGALYRTSGAVGTGNGGTTILTGSNTYSGDTVVEEGTLLVNNTTGSGTGISNVTVGASGKLGGSGTISGSVTSSGTLTPGNSPGVLTIGGNLSLLGGVYKYEIDSTPVATADLVNVTGNLSITPGAVTLQAIDLGSAVLAMGTKFTLINYGGTWNGGTFIGLPNYDTSLVVGANRFAIQYNDTTGGQNFGGGSVGVGSSFVTITAVPEASTFLVIGLGGVFAFAAVRMGKRLGVNVLNV